MKKMMQKLLAIALCAALAFSASAPALAAMVSVTTTSDTSDQNISGAAVIGDTIYYAIAGAKGMGLYARKANDPAVTALGNSGELEAAPEDFHGGELLFAWNEKLYALDLASGSYFSLLDEQNAFAIQKQEPVLDTSALVEKEGEATYYISMTSFFAAGDYLYYTGQSYSQGYMSIAGRVSLITGESQTFETPSIMSLAPYEDGKLIAYVYDSSALYTSGDNSAVEDALKQAGTCGVFDPETDTLGTSWPITTDNILGGMSIGGFCYGNGTVYFSSGSRITGLDMATGATRVSGYTGDGLYGSAMSGGMHLYANGYYVSYGYNGMMVYQLDGENLGKGALRVYGEMGSEAHKSFVKNYPDIPVEVAGEYTSSLEALTQAMVTENDPYDVLLLSLNYMPVERLLKKGYCADLSDNADLWELVNQMYPQLGEILQRDGKLYGVPTDVSAYAFGVNMKNWEEIGLTEDDLPKSYPELLDFAANWTYDYGDDYPDISLFDYPQSSMMIFSLMLESYLAYTQWKGETTLFDTPVYRELLRGYEAVDFDEIDALLGKETRYVESSKTLFSFYSPIIPLNYRDSYVTPLYLSLADGEEPFIAGSVTVMIINPKTTRMDDAVLYMKNYLNNLPKDGANIVMFPERNEPVENRYYAQNKEASEEGIKKKNEQLASASEENKAAIRDEIKTLEDSLVTIEENRYSVSPEQIAEYREQIVPKLFIQPQNMLYSADQKALTEINTLMTQYIAKAIDADKMITELDNRLRLMALEDDN